jgi:stage II sporulation protein D
LLVPGGPFHHQLTTGIDPLHLQGMDAMDLMNAAHSRWFQRAVCLFLLVIGLPSGCMHHIRPADFSGRTPLLRVLILQNQTSVGIMATQSPSARLKSDVSDRHLELSAPVVVTCAADGWHIGSASFKREELTVSPTSEGTVFIDGRAYRGHYRFIPRANNNFDVINDVDVEGYLKGVLQKELYTNFLEETYKAQAVVARTYAIYEKQTRPKGSEFDLFSDEHSQVYGGISAETEKARKAVDDTHGIVVAYGPPGEERIFKAYFSSCCGGLGQSAAEAFGDPVIPPLSAQAMGTLCSASPKFNWQPIGVSKMELTHRIQHYAQLHNMPEKDMAAVSRIDILSLNSVGRPVMFTITDVKNRRYAIVGEELRRAVNTDSTPPTKLPSSLFQLDNRATEIWFVNGHGQGHGVGMCQWGAERRAELGEKYDQIVLQSYPQSVLLKAYDWETSRAE